jgi:putative hydrolase of the HAD superfamily
MALFDHVIESAKIGLRKPDPRIYQMMVEALGVDPKNCVYLDDLGVNLNNGHDDHQSSECLAGHRRIGSRN